LVTYNKHRWWCKELLKCLDAGAKVKVVEKIHGILFEKKVKKNIIRKVFFISEPFITATNNTGTW